MSYQYQQSQHCSHGMRLRQAGPKHRRLVDVCDEFLTPLVTVVLVVALLKMMPELLMYISGIFGSAFSFLLGLIFGLLLSILLLVSGFYLLTKKILDEDRNSGTGLDNSTTETLWDDDEEIKKGGKHPFEPNVVRNGSFAAPVWIVACSKWDITKPLRKFPPADIGVGYDKGLMKYHASIKNRILTFSSLDITNRWRAVLKVDLEGCHCRFVDECLKVHNILWKKAPIEISHPNRALYQGEFKFLMFCAHGADKEQWMITLQSHLKLGENIKTLQNTYKKFSKRCQNTTTFLTPNQQSIKYSTNKSNEDKSPQIKRGIWLSNWRRGGVNSRLPSQSSEPCLQAMDIAVALDQRWKGERSKSQKDEIHHHHHRHHRKPRNRKPSHHNHENRVLNFDNKSESIPEDSVHGGGSFSRSNMSSQEDLIHTEDGVLGLNLFLARWSFDAMRNPEFKNKFHHLILKKLRALRRPDFITELSVSGLELGSNFPEIKSVRSAPFSTDLILPELLLDVSYSGGLEFKVEATLDLREGVVWESVDRAFNGWQGTSKSEEEEEDFESTEDVEGVQRRQPISDKNASSRRSFATRGAKLATRVVESIPKIQLGLSVKIVSLEGTMSVWAAPPPASRLWVSFVGSPKLELEANPIFGNRLMKYSAYLGRVSSWLQGKIKNSFLNNLVFPMCADLRFPGLLSLADESGLALPTGHIMKDLNLYPESESDEERPEATTPRPILIPDRLQVKARSIDDSLVNLKKDDLSAPKTTSFQQSCGTDILPQEDPETDQLFDRSVPRAYHSLSDGDICEDASVEVENSKLSLEQDCIVSDSAEFFDADTSTSIRPTTSSSSETDLPQTTPIQWPQQLPSSRGIQLNRRSSCKTQNDGEDSPEAPGKVTPTKGLGGWFSEIVKTVQTTVEDGEVSRRQRAMHRGNQFVKTARQKAGEQGTKLKEAIKNRTAPLRSNVMLNRDSTPARRFSLMD